MFSCLWQLWDWLEPTSMENAKGVYQNNSPSNNEIVIEATTQKHLHQHATGPPPPHLRLLQYGLKPSNNNPTPNSPLYLHIHPQQLQYQSIATHRHLQTSPQQFNNKYVVHQNQMYTPVYHPAPPPPLHPYTAQPIQQNTPQIWVPHQPPPIHYHHQQQNKFHSPETPKTVTAPPTQPKTTPPTKELVERKKSSQSCQLRSPAAKRPPEAPVTMQGWLHKQGSEGLMLWKKRWFVLSEYCLFYYKGLEEEKLLGSILLPSYKVSVCGPESKVNRKFAFKCEHANMRTYLLAADSQELMQQWIRVLNLACLLQSNVETTPYLSNSQSNEESPDNNNQTKNGQVPLHMHSSSNTTELSNQSQQELSQFNQPLYANAPPKPRRLNDGGYSSPSPDVLERYMTPQYGRSPYNFPLSLPQPQEYIQHPHNRLVHPHPHEYNFPNSNTQNVERRTPDTYGRSKLTPDKHHIDYEDVYIDQSVYKRPLSPIAYNHITKKNNPPVVVNPAYRTYTPVNMLGPNHPITMRKSPSQISRPHSADFLEYEFNHRSPSNQTKQQPRPKSSLDINRNPDSDNYFYSEERYAEKMRKSALYLQNTQQPQIIKPPHLHLPQPTRCRSVLSEGSLSRELDSPCERDVVSPGYHPQNANYYARTTPGQFDQFARSASARLAEDVQGDRKREESMKRLLEWKQRMLQSPLNRKAQGNRRQEYYMLQPPENMYGMPKYHLDSSSDGRRSVNHLPQYNSYSSDDEASGSISLNARETFPRALSGKKVWQPTNNPKMLQSRSITNVNKNGDHESNYGHPGFFIGQSPSQQDMNPDPSYIRKDNVNDKMNVSAGELLGRTHEELVLLLIQLRRQSSHNLQSIENAYNEIDTIQAQLHMMDHARRLENLQKLDQIKQHLLELEKQYEKSKPLVNLVDNMVKLGSLYRVPSDKNSSIIRDRSEFNQQVQERRLLAEEKRDWNRLNPNHIQLQEKVQQLYQLDKLIQEESGTLYNLQQDKEDIERALGGLRMRLTKGFSDPAEVEHARKQQMILESELSRVHMMLAKNAKKLEETVAGNARLEQELLVLKQKLQTSRQQRSSPQFSNPGDSLPCVVGTSVMLESDLQKVQKKIGDLQKQRQELSMQVRQLTDRSNNLAQLKPLPLNSAALQNVQCNKRRVPSLWRETDLDTMDSIDHGDSWDNQLPPLYINTELKQSTEVEDPSSSNPIEKQQEIKTVRIVKRESERRQRDREKTMAPLTGKWDPLLEEDDSSQNSSILFRPTPAKTPQIIPNQSNYPESSSTEKSPELSPIFKSEAARQIITEMSTPQEAPPQNKQPNRRVVPKEKRRHYTAPHNNLIMKSLHQLPTDDNAFDKMILNTRRARDDLDMERALRQRIDAPDVVRSTLSNKELKYNESTIDNLLGTPNKISIPERYIPEQLPQLTVEEQEHRLRKVESIKKMLSDTTIISGSSKTQEDSKNDEPINSIVNKSTTKMIEEKKQREHLLQLNQILAKQVMEMSKIVAVKALSKLPLEAHQNGTTEEEDLSPMTPLPLYQQRDNFYS